MESSKSEDKEMSGRRESLQWVNLDLLEFHKPTSERGGSSTATRKSLLSNLLQMLFEPNLTI